MRISTRFLTRLIPHTRKKILFFGLQIKIFRDKIFLKTFWCNKNRNPLVAIFNTELLRNKKGKSQENGICTVIISNYLFFPDKKTPFVQTISDPAPRRLFRILIRPKVSGGPYESGSATLVENLDSDSSGVTYDESNDGSTTQLSGIILCLTFFQSSD